MTVALRLPLPLLLLFAATLLLTGLGTLGLTDRDEGSNAEAAREMVETGDWITPTLNYEPRFAKPVLIYWLISACYRLFGVSEFTARLPSALFAVALVALQYLFLTRTRGPLIALLSGLMLLLNSEVLAIGRMVLTDSVLCFFTTLAIYGFWLGLHGSAERTTGPGGRRRHCFWLFYVGMALGTLTKGPVGLLVPLLATAPYLTVTRRWRQFWDTGFPIAGTLLCLALAAPWYAAMVAIHGARYTQSAQADTVGRFLTVIGGHGGTIFFYLPVLLVGFFPWSGFLPAALWQAFKNWREARGPALDTTTGRRDDAALAVSPRHLVSFRPPAPQELELFAALWLVSVFVFFSLSATRLPHYIAPLFPAAALLAASYWQRGLADPATPGLRASLRTMMGLGYLLGLALAATPSLYGAFVDQVAREFPMAAQADPGWSPVAAGLVLVIGMALVGYFSLAEARRPGVFWIAGATFTLVALITILVGLPRFSRLFLAPEQELAYIAGLNLGPDDRLIAYGRPRPSLIFYARRKLLLVKPGEEETMRPYLRQPGRTMVLLQARMKATLPPEAAGYETLLARGGYLLLANEPMVRVPASPRGGPGGPPRGIPGHS
ncbi:ArnT family glycosyltransferase [Nitrospira sp. Kam-Ns4a]